MDHFIWITFDFIHHIWYDIEIIFSQIETCIRGLTILITPILRSYRYSSRLLCKPDSDHFSESCT